MEPRILLIGRQPSTVEVLVEELQRYGRMVKGAADHVGVESAFKEGPIDFVVIGGGLDDPSRSEMDVFVKTIRPSVPIHFVPRSPAASAASVVPFVNKQAILFKVHAAVPKPAGDPRPIVTAPLTSNDDRTKS